MAVAVIMPKQGLQMTEGKIVRWLAAEGAAVAADAPLFEIETDKLTITIDAPADGTLLRTFHREGETVPITRIVGVIGAPGEDLKAIEAEWKTQAADGAPAAAGAGPDRTRGTIADMPAADHPAAVAAAVAAAAQPSGRSFATPRARAKADARGLDWTILRGSGPDGLVIEKDVPDLTPLAARVANDRGVPSEGIRGSGPRGRITKADLEAVLTAAPPASAPGDRLIPLSGMRRTIAARMTKSLATEAQASHRMKVDMGEAVRLREELLAAGRKVSYQDIVMKAVARALGEHPILNSSWTEKGILLHGDVNIGFAVALEDGLLVPVVRAAGTLSLAEIATRSAALLEKARAGRLLPDEAAGGTFTITNLGMFDVDEFTAIVNPPESAILALGRIARTPVADANDRVVVRPLMTMSLTYDHRVIDGAPAARFLQRVRQLLQDPYLMI